MMFIIIHGAYGHPEENWFPWLKKELEGLGHEVLVPRFPTPEGQSLENWMKVMNKHPIDENTVMIGHSIGPALILRILEKQKLRAAFLVAGFLGALDSEEVDEINSSFFKDPFDWDAIKNNCKNIFVIGSDNDPYVPLEKTNELARNLGVEPIMVKDAGHFNKAAGYTEFPFLLEKIKKLL